MRALVFIKQVPEVAEVKFDLVTRRIVRQGVPNVVNPFDRRALTEAIRLRDAAGGDVVAVTMGPPQAREALLDALVMGSDRAVHLLDPAFAGADTLATARTLAAAARRLGFDLIFCGKYTVDAETGQIGPELAELLDVPHVTGVTQLELHGRSFEATRETDEGFEVLAGTLPAVLTAAERLNKPIKPDPGQRTTALEARIDVWSAADLALDRQSVGATGSPTWVEGITTMAVERRPEQLEGNPVEMAQLLVDALRRRRVFEPDDARPRGVLVDAARAGGPAVWAVTESSAGELRRVSLELLSGAARVAAGVEGQVVGVLVGSEQAPHAPTLARYGADHILLLDAPVLDDYAAEPYASALAEAISARTPWAVLFPATANGRDYAPRVAARLRLGLTGDAIGLEVDPAGQMVALKPAFGGNVVASVLSRTTPALATVRPGMLAPLPRTLGRRPALERVVVSPRPARLQRVKIGREAAAASHALDDAEAVVCVGTGIGGAENLGIAHDLAEALGAAIGATRRVSDLGWLPRQQQIGLTGRSVEPRLYIALGVRGAFNHLIGMLRSEVVVAINSDPGAEIFKVADYALVGDLHQIVPALTKALRAAKLRMGDIEPVSQSASRQGTS